MENSSSIKWNLNLVLFIGVHLLPLLALWTHVTPFDWGVCFVLYVVRMFFVTGGYHRYFAHRTYKTSRWFQFFLAFMSQTSAQKGVLWWSAHHRVHHKFSDTPEDPHSKKVHGFWQSHVGWIIGNEFNDTDEKLVKDLVKYPELVWIDRNHYVPPVVLGAVVTFLGAKVNGGDFSMILSHGMSTLLIGFFLSTVILYHATFSINSVMHWIGKPRYKTGDESKNSFWLAILSLGEGWHNNHHYYQSATRQGFFWWEIDFTYYTLKILSWLGLVWEIREVPSHVKHAQDKLLKTQSL